MFAWAFAEATVWPIIPDFLLVPLVIGNRRRFFVPLAASIAGSALGGTMLYLFAFSAPEQATSLLAHLPLIGHGAVAEVRRQIAAHGTAAFLLQPVSGVPFKVWGIVGATEGIAPGQAIPIFIAARALRMAVLATAARILSGACSGFFRDFSLLILAIYLFLFFAVWWHLVR